MQVRKQQLELDMEQQTGSKEEKEYVKAVYCHPVYLPSMQSTSWEMLGWKKHKLESKLLGEISITSDIQMTPPLWQKEELNSLLMKVKEEWKSWLKAQHSENEDHGIWWWTGRPGVLRFMGSQGVGHNWSTELNWTKVKHESRKLTHGLCQAINCQRTDSFCAVFFTTLKRNN